MALPTLDQLIAMTAKKAGLSKNEVTQDATLEDLGSKNGTYVQRKRVTSARLSDGDELRIGNASLIFRIEPPLEPTATVVMDPDAS